jgi:hypothetical protein
MLSDRHVQPFHQTVHILSPLCWTVQMLSNHGIQSFLRPQCATDVSIHYIGRSIYLHISCWTVQMLSDRGVQSFLRSQCSAAVVGQSALQAGALSISNLFWVFNSNSLLNSAGFCLRQNARHWRGRGRMAEGPTLDWAAGGRPIQGHGERVLSVLHLLLQEHWILKLVCLIFH